MLVSTHFDPVIGLDIHIVLVPTPAGPVPTPLPFPFVGVVWKPPGNPVAILKKMIKEAPKRLGKAAVKQLFQGGNALEEEISAMEDEIVSESLGEFANIGKGKVQVNQLPVTHTGDGVKLLVPHPPVPGPFQKPPSNDAELLFGGLMVAFEDAMVVRLGDIAMSCFDPTGRAPVSTVLAIPKGPLVLVPRPPVPDLKLIAQKIKDWAKGKLQKVAAKLKRKLFKQFRKHQKRSLRWKHLSAVVQVRCRKDDKGLRSMWNRKVCRVTGHPVDVATGRMFTDNVDFELPGPLPLRFERVYDTSLSYRRGPLGHGWFHSLDVALYPKRGAMVLRAEDGREIEFSTWELPDHVFQVGTSVRHPIERSTLRCVGRQKFELETADGLIWSFGPVAGTPELKAIEKRRRDGAAIRFAYDAGGLLEHVVDSTGRKVLLTHDRGGRLQKVSVQPTAEAAPQTVVTYAYDANDDLTSATDALGGTWRYAYQCHLMVQESNRNGLSFYFVYDGVDEGARCVRTWGDDGIYDHEITYAEGTTVVENSLGHVTVYKQDETGQVVSIIDATGAETKYAYDETSGQQTAEILPDGSQTRWVFDEQGHCISIVGPDGAELKLEHGPLGLPTKVVDAQGAAWHWSYDGLGHLVGRRDPLGRAQQFEWQGPQLVGVTDALGQQSRLEYDAQGNLASLRAPDGTTTRWAHDPWGRVVAATDAKGNVQHREWDALGRLVRVHEPDGNERRLAYDAEGNVVHAKDVHHDVRFTYQGMNRLRKREEAGTAVRFAYDTEEQLLGVQNEHGMVYQFVLGPTGLVQEEWGFDRRKRTYLRDPVGRVQQVIRPQGETIGYTYDVAGRVVEVEHSDGTKESFAYRVDGAMLVAGNADVVVKFERDVLGRVTKEVQGEEWVASSFDGAGFRTGIRSSKGLRHTIRRNGMGDVLGLSAYVEAGGHDLPFEFAHVDGAGARAYEAQFERDSVGLEIARHLPGGVSARWERDALGRPVRQSLEVRGQEVRARVYKWEPNDRLKQMLDSVSGPITFEHDALGSLVSATFQDSAERTLRELRMPDAVGNLFRTRECDDRKYGPSGELLEARGPEGVTTFAYDVEGNLVKKVGPDGEWRYEWNGAGRLVKVRRPDGTEVTFGYDALGRRVWKQWKGKRTCWIWDGNVPLHEWVERVEVEGDGAMAEGGDAAAQAQQAALLVSQPAQGPPAGVKAFQQAAAAGGTAERPITWLFEPESFTPMAKLVGDDKFSIVADHLGVPTSMVDELGRVVWQAQIGTWGDLKDVQGVKGACPFRWPGQYEDEETGLYYNRFRYYAPEAGQYVSRDPIGLLGGLERHGYVKDPLSDIDPLGLSCEDHRFATKPNQAYFWSGRTRGKGGEANARAIAESRGGVTLEKIIEDRGITMPKYDPADPASEKAWNDASASYARGASGEVHAVIGEDLRQGNVWQKSELNVLIDNKKVTRLVQIDPATGSEKVLFER
ncbi:MAG: RHS domain-containing protein [Myxococcales bacterium]|nr:RHS domain-containing protein [Myxococcales bacterium]